MNPTLRALLVGTGILAAAPLVHAQTAVPANLAVPASLVDTNSSGFRVRIFQGNTRLQPNAIIPAERLLSGHAIDPQTNEPFVNDATPNPADNSFHYQLTTINLHDQIPNDPNAAGGNFSSTAAAPLNITDEAVPGIPGVNGGADDYVVEFTGFLQIPQGNVQFGVNSDDGFRLTIGDQNQPGIGRQQLIVLDGTRGFANTEGNFSFTAGIYPFRLIFWERGGGTAGVEFYAFQPGQTAGTRYLINDRSQANAIRSYADPAGNPPRVLNAWPDLTVYLDLKGNGGPVPPAPFMWVEMLDGGSALDPNSVVWTLDGNPLVATTTKSGNTNTITVQAPTLNPNSVHTNRLVYATADGARYTNSWPFTVSNYPIPQDSYRLSAVDTSKPGFKVKVHQMSPNRNPGTAPVPNSERQIANGYFDPATGTPFPNTADLTGADSDGYFSVPGVINWNQDVADIGSFPGDTAIPGIGAGTVENSTDRFVQSIETILELKAGPIRFGVNSDDGFRLSIGRGPGDVVGTQLGTAGERGPTDSFLDAMIPADGFYPVRLMWFETGGGAAVEFFVVNLATGEKSLINDPNALIKINAYQDSPESRPYISRVLPAVNYTYAIADEDIIIDITDGAIPLDAGSAVLTLNGVAQTLTPTKSGKVTTLVRDSSVSNLLPSGVVNASLVYSYTPTGGSAVLTTNNWSFTVPRYTRVIPAGNKVLASQVSGEGFTVRANLMDRSLSNNQGNGGRDTGNNMPGPEIQLAGGYIDPVTDLTFPNLIDPTDSVNGVYTVPGVLNANHNTGAGTGGVAANSGIFNADVELPGIPGTGTSNQGMDNSVHEYLTYLELKAGAYVMGVNVDDGWVLTSAPNAKDTLGTLVGFRNAPGGNAGSPANNPNAAFNLIVPEDGIYPFRLLMWQGGGGINIEFFEIERNTGAQVLVNDMLGEFPSVVAVGNANLLPLASKIKAYSTYTGPTRPWTKFSVYPMPYIGTTEPRDTSGGAVTLWQNRRQQSGPGPIEILLGLWNGSWNTGEHQNSGTATRPFGDAVGAIVADVGTSSVGMVLDGQSVTPTVTDIAGSSDKLVLYTPSAPLSPSSNHVAGLIYGGTTSYWTFSVITNVIVDATNKVDATADASKRGFKVKVAQAATGQANTVARAENQLQGTPASVALPGTEADGSFIHTNIINFNMSANAGTTNQNGNFNTLWSTFPELPIPGLPGTNLTGNPRWENFTAEITGYLDLPAGYQKFGINGDDGFRVQIGKSGETNSLVVFSTGDRGGGSTDFPFAFVVPEAGLYPVRIVWWQGTGGGNLELFTYGPNNTKVPVNSDNPNAVKAYFEVSGGPVDQPRITEIMRIANGDIHIVWVNGGSLEATELLGDQANWQVVDSDGDYTAPAPTGNRFFRVRK
ncbi:MAG TPA: hypothetical protein VF773_16880 [Verrucomicrobiae bacterium]